jgi:hypothetical protein
MKSVILCVTVSSSDSSDDEDSQGGSFGPGNDAADKERFAR